jgi:hypothetical protein
MENNKRQCRLMRVHVAHTSAHTSTYKQLPSNSTSSNDVKWTIIVIHNFIYRCIDMVEKGK